MVMKMPMTSAAGTSIHQSLSDGARWPRPSMMASLHTVAKSAAGVPTVAQGSGDSVSASSNQNIVGGMLQRALPPHASIRCATLL
ncbi:Os07g0527550 [Oryza sativa Japonica Group]|uniref:Os07g0527550 protein n=1 Tax=Oryza sativa subsp. japonica TaxID=39947 RepID=A0A0P0X6N7_ORYSJ|nr:Os07g0527550 [Oryza sativa Japonica Group]